MSSPRDCARGGWGGDVDTASVTRPVAIYGQLRRRPRQASLISALYARLYDCSDRAAGAGSGFQEGSELSPENVPCSANERREGRAAETARRLTRDYAAV